MPLSLAVTLPPHISPRSAEINKPAIQPPFSESVQDKDFRANLPYRRWRYQEWSNYWIPKHCLEEAESNKLSPADFTVRDVWYEDCVAAWTICRHNNAKEPWESIINTLSQVPVGMRSHVANLIILPGPAPGLEDAAAYTRGSILAFTPSYFRLGVLFHEFTHILDMVALQGAVASRGYPDGTPFSRTHLWKWAIQNDTAVPTPYARATLEEDFADAGRWAMSDMTRGGRGLADYSAGWAECRNQIWGYEAWLGEVIFPAGGVCVGKIAGSEAVVTPARGPKEQAGMRPKGNLEGTDIKEIFLPRGAENMLFVYHGTAPTMW
ncbi:hypothetical protein B0H67DRAFT_492008 [Lasiosphaeris hirsuta]|uniref:Conidiation-specific protein 13 n=1 Tax=Lasiosphaeris hirsuta TaxID=260670 RepID=A0AA40A9S4_9PEZI|nr:hypothetical protein B0H67DRAFT_492008 [Lasiosphaeris hirsuta]